MARILLIEDDLYISAQVKEWLELDQSFSAVDAASCGEDGLQLVRNFGYDLVIVDYELPGVSGYDVCKTLRDEGMQMPVMFLTGKKLIEDKEKGFSAGADDYLTKPFELKELSFRCKALLRRPSRISDLSCDAGQVRLDIDAKVLHVYDCQVNVSKLEIAFLTHLMRHPNKIFPAHDVLKFVWPSDKNSGEEAVRSMVRALRIKLDATKNAKASALIETVRGQGYVLRA